MSIDFVFITLFLQDVGLGGLHCLSQTGWARREVRKSGRSMCFAEKTSQSKKNADFRNHLRLHALWCQKSQASFISNHEQALSLQ